MRVTFFSFLIRIFAAKVAKKNNPRKLFYHNLTLFLCLFRYLYISLPIHLSKNRLFVFMGVLFFFMNETFMKKKICYFFKNHMINFESDVTNL